MEALLLTMAAALRRINRRGERGGAVGCCCRLLCAVCGTERAHVCTAVLRFSVLRVCTAGSGATRAGASAGWRTGALCHDSPGRYHCTAILRSHYQALHRQKE
eukprot:94201-Rhodomonas_salina.4